MIKYTVYNYYLWVIKQCKNVSTSLTNKNVVFLTFMRSTNYWQLTLYKPDQMLLSHSAETNSLLLVGGFRAFLNQKIDKEYCVSSI